MLNKMFKLLLKLILISLIITMISSYSEGNLRQHIVFTRNPEVAREVEKTIDMLTLKGATNFIKNLPVK